VIDVVAASNGFGASKVDGLFTRVLEEPEIGDCRGWLCEDWDGMRVNSLGDLEEVLKPK
jgi:hypothetical protein